MKQVRPKTNQSMQILRSANLQEKQRLLNQGLCIGSVAKTGYYPLRGLEGRVVKINPTQIKVLFEDRIHTFPFSMIELIK
jgi:hypothetical protein